MPYVVWMIGADLYRPLKGMYNSGVFKVFLGLSLVITAPAATLKTLGAPVCCTAKQAVAMCMGVLIISMGQVRLRGRGQGGYAAVRVGEAAHPGPPIAPGTPVGGERRGRDPSLGESP